MKGTKEIAVLVVALVGCVADRPSLVSRLEIGTPVRVNDTVSICVAEKHGTAIRGIILFETLPNGLHKTIEAESGTVTETPGTGVAVIRMHEVHIGGDLPISTNLASLSYEIRHKMGDQ